MIQVTHKPGLCQTRAGGLRAAPLAAALLLGACVAQTGAVRPAGGSIGGPVSLTVDGHAFAADIRAGRAGMELTRHGARPVQGQEIRVTRAATPLRMDEGAQAKRAARAGCAEAGGRFNETAIGGYDRAGGWVFPGGCA